MKNNQDNQESPLIRLTITGSFFYRQEKEKRDYIPLTIHSILLKREPYHSNHIVGYVPLTHHSFSEWQKQNKDNFNNSSAIKYHK